MTENIGLTQLKKLKPGHPLMVLQNYRRRGKVGGWQAVAISARIIRVNKKTILVKLDTNQRIENIQLDRVLHGAAWTGRCDKR